MKKWQRVALAAALSAATAVGLAAAGLAANAKPVVTGTQDGPLLGIPATGRHLQWDAIDLYRLKGGKISQEWASEDLTAILNDTGTYKAPWIP
jgi:predicted ester cyclase